MAMTRERMIVGPFLKKGNVLFNDKMPNGGRSIKVWGWKEEDYDLAQKALEDAGYTVKRIVTPLTNVGRIYQSGGCTRLQIT